MYSKQMPGTGGLTEGKPGFGENSALKTESPEPETTLLFVDDNRNIVDLAVRLLRDLRPGWKLVTAGSYREALEAAAGKNISAAVLDFELGDGNGLDLMAELRAAAPTLPVVIVSGSAGEDLRKKNRASREFFFLEKPFSFGALLNRVDEQIQSVRQTSEPLIPRD